METTRVLIIIEGGAVRDVYADAENVEVLIVDYDTDGVEPESIKRSVHGDDYVGRIEPAAVDPELTGAFFAREQE
ncbi:MAG: hypothetical protein HYY96_08535 [Candidatus Tectomicrobia bacterium]|nr:hypothetical protein [Candidatus Tectomicrobia bacterium]